MCACAFLPAAFLPPCLRLQARHDGAQSFLRRFHAGEVYCTMATAGVSLLERQRRYQDAVERLQMLLGGWAGGRAVSGFGWNM